MIKNYFESINLDKAMYPCPLQFLFDKSTFFYKQEIIEFAERYQE